MSQEISVIDNNSIQNRIFTIRGLQVMLDRDLAELYQVETRALKQAVKRNAARFPEDFMFVLDDGEINLLVSQSVIPSKKQLGGAKPFVFTEQGVATLSSVLTSNKAIEINILIMRAFVDMRKFIANNAAIFQRLKQSENQSLEWNIKRHLTKINYRIHTDAIKENLIPLTLGQNQISYVYASEADVLNMALFGKTSKQWRKENPDKDGLAQAERFPRLNQIAIAQMKILVDGNVAKGLSHD